MGISRFSVLISGTAKPMLMGLSLKHRGDDREPYRRNSQNSHGNGIFPATSVLISGTAKLITWDLHWKIEEIIGFCAGCDSHANEVAGTASKFIKKRKITNSSMIGGTV